MSRPGTGLAKVVDYPVAWVTPTGDRYHLVCPVHGRVDTVTAPDATWLAVERKLTDALHDCDSAVYPVPVEPEHESGARPLPQNQRVPSIGALQARTGP